MYNTSKFYKEKVLEDSTQHELNIYIDGNKIEPNHIIDFSSKSELFNNNEFCLGCTPEKDIEFEIDKRDLPETYEEVYVETGVKYHEDIVTEGENITLKEEKEIPLNLEISGNSKQETRSGKNLLELVDGTYSHNGITAVVKNGVITLNGTATALAFPTVPLKNDITLSANIQYTLRAFNEKAIGSEAYHCTLRLGDNGVTQAVLYTENTKYIHKIVSDYSFNHLTLRTAEGITYNNFVIKPQLELEIGTDTWEQGGTSPSLDYRSEVKCCGDNVNLLNYNNISQSAKDVGIKIDNDENIYDDTPTGDNRTWNYNKSNYFIALNKGTYTVTLYFSKQASEEGSILRIYSETSEIYFTSCANKDKVSAKFTLSEKTNIGIMFKIYDGICKIKLSEGTDIGEYSSYGQGCITDVISNKNLSKYKNFTSTSSARIVGDITSSGQQIKGIKVKKGKKYTVSFDIAGLPASDYRIQIKESTDENVTQTSGEIPNSIQNEPLTCNTLARYSKTITAQGDNYLYIRCVPNGFVLDNIQVEEKETATSYEEHKEQKYIIPTQQPFRSIGDIRDIFIKKDNKWYERHYINEIILKGTETWYVWNTIQAGEKTSAFLIRELPRAKGLINEHSGCQYLSNYFLFQDSNDYNQDKELLFINESNALGIRISKEKASDLNSFKTYLSEQYNSGTPIYAYYMSATPTDIECTEEQSTVLEELSYATTYSEITHIYSPDSIAPVLKTTCGSEIVPIGKFTIQKPIEDDEFKVKIKATDYMKKFEDNKYDGSNLIYPETMLEVLKDICKKVGVELGSTSFLNSEKQIAVYDNTVTARTYLGYIAEQAGGFAIIGRDGKLYIKKFGEDIIDFDIDLFGDFTWGDKFKVSKVSYEDGIQNYKFGDETQATVFIDQNNMYIVDNKQVENIYNQIKNFEVYTFEGETIIDPAYDIGDILVIDGKKVLYQGEIKYAGKFKASINNKVQAKTEQESMQTKQTNSNKIKRVQSEINQIDGKITQLVKETTENEEKITQAQQDIDGFSQKVATKDELTEKVNELKQTIDGITAQTKETGGNNIFFYAKEYWHGSTQNSNATLEEYTNTLIQQNNISDEGYLINNGISVQSQVVKNGQYVISFNYYKLKSDATGYIKVNDIEYKLDGNVNTWNEKIIPITVTSNSIKIELGSDTVASYYISDLMVTTGTEKSIWTQNPNETRTDTVEIGKGLKIKSSTKNTVLKADADGVRVVSTNTNKIVSEFTDKGMETDEIIVREKAQISSLLIQEVNGQVWITGIGG